MPNIKSAKKRVKIASKAQVLNNDLSESTKTAIKKLEKSVREGNKEDAVMKLNEVSKKIDKSVKAGIVKNNKRDRVKSKLAKKVNSMK